VEKQVIFCNPESDPPIRALFKGHDLKIKRSKMMKTHTKTAVQIRRLFYSAYKQICFHNIVCSQNHNTLKYETPRDLVRVCGHTSAHYRGADKSLALTRKETRSEACQGRAGFQQHRDARCHQVFFSCKTRRRRKITPFWQKH